MSDLGAPVYRLDFENPADAFDELQRIERDLGFFEPACFCYFGPGRVSPSRMPDGTQRFFIVLPVRSVRPGCQLHAPMTIRVRRPRWKLWKPKVERTLTTDEAIDLIFAGRRPR